MYLGSMIEIGQSDDVFFDPQHPYTQLLIGSNPEPDPNHERTRTSVSIPGEIPSPVNIPPGCRFASRCPKVMDVCREQNTEFDSAGGRSAKITMWHAHLFDTPNSTVVNS